MRGRASGFGASISSMVLVILGVSIEVQWTDNLLNERNFTSRDAILSVEVIVCPFPCPLLCRNERVDPARRVLGWLVQKDQEASQPTGEVGQDTLGLCLR